MDEKRTNPEIEQEILEEIATRRSEKIHRFQMRFGIEDIDDIPDVEIHYDQPEEAPVFTEPEEEELPVKEKAKKKKEKKVKKPREKAAPTGVEKFLRSIISFLLILAVSGFLAMILLIFVLDSMAINRTADNVDLEIPKGSTTVEIADLLVERGLIDNALCFRIYSRISGSDGKWQVGAFTVSPDMGYAALVEILQTMTPRETVTVTIPEGFTVEEIGELLEKKGVCTWDELRNAINHGEYDYDFVHEIPTAADGVEHAGRVYRLEGYLFPDTYNFYVGSSGETVVSRMLENFDKKLTPKIRKQITARGWTIDEAIIVASLVEGEAASKEDMEKVSRVLANRMEPDSGYPKLQLCSTKDYVKDILPSLDGEGVRNISYNTYEREGLPVGAINNPGLQALTAALNPSDDESVENCYFFATDYDTETTYFSDTYEEHEWICRKYGIGMYG